MAEMAGAALHNADPQRRDVSQFLEGFVKDRPVLQYLTMALASFRVSEKWVDTFLSTVYNSGAATKDGSGGTASDTTLRRG